MTPSARFITRLSIKYELYDFFIIIPPALYFGYFACGFRGDKLNSLIIAAMISICPVVIATLILRLLILYPLLNSIDSEGADIHRIKKDLLNYPMIEGICGLLRWTLGLGLTYIIMHYLIGTPLTSIDKIAFLVVLSFELPISVTLIYYVTENALRPFLEHEKIKRVMLPPGSYREMSIFYKIIVFAFSIMVIPLIIVGFLFLLANADLARFSNLQFHLLFIGFLSAVEILVTTYEGTSSIRASIRMTNTSLHELAMGNLDIATVPQFTKDEIGGISRSINTLADALRVYERDNKELTENLEQKVTQRTEELTAAMDELESMNIALTQARDELWGEMELAKKIQTMLLPTQPEIKGFDVSVFMAPASDVGGDYYDVINIANRDWVLIGDVSGHGVAAGLIMMMVQTAINVAIGQKPDIMPAELLSNVNRTLMRSIQQFGDDKYMTITALAIHQNESFYFSGLHQDIMIYRAGSGTVDMVETSGIWIGISREMQVANKDNTFCLNKGDAVLLYTDGITEAWKKGSRKDHRDAATDMFGQQRLAGILKSAGHRSPDFIRNTIITELDDYICNDDVTMVILKRV